MASRQTSARCERALTRDSQRPTAATRQQRGPHRERQNRKTKKRREDEDRERDRKQIYEKRCRISPTEFLRHADSDGVSF